MSETRTTDNERQAIRTLADAIKHIDKDQDTRDCPHECHGVLTVTDDNVVLCQSCRCTPDGVYYPPEQNDSSTNSGRVKSNHNPWGQRREHGNVDRYRHSNKVRLAGGYTEAYPQELTTRDDSLI